MLHSLMAASNILLEIIVVWYQLSDPNLYLQQSIERLRYFMLTIALVSR